LAAVVLYDACVLHPAPLRDLLLRVARTGLFRAKLTNEILDECFASILRERPDLNMASLDRTRRLMIDAVPDILVRNYAPLIVGLELPDPKDRHVLAAAIRSGAQTIVTFNLKDFPETVLAGYDIVADHPDVFLLRLLDLSPHALLAVLDEQAEVLRAPKMSVEDVLARLEVLGIAEFVSRVRDLRQG